MTKFVDLGAFLKGTPREFPLNPFPSAVRSLVVIGSQSIVCPLPFIATAVLATCAVVLGGNRKLRIKPGYTLSGNIIACIVGEPGSRKTPAISLALAPLYQLQKRLMEMANIFEDSPSFCSTIVTTDTTMEALMELLSQTDKLLLLKEEFVGFLNSMNQYRAGDDQQKFLSMYAQVPIVLNRKGKPPMYVLNPTLSILGGMQIDVLSSLAKLLDDGLLDRVMFAFPNGIPASHSDVEIPESVLKDYSDLIEKLYKLNSKEIHYLELSPDAKITWREWHIEFCDLLNHQGLTSFMRPKLHKLEACVGKFALILEYLAAIDEGREPIEVSATSILGGIELVNYFGANLYKVGETFETNSLDKKMEKVTAWFKKHGNKVQPLRNILGSRVANLKNRDEAMDVLRELRARNIGRFWPDANGEGDPKIIKFSLMPHMMPKPQES